MTKYEKIMKALKTPSKDMGLKQHIELFCLYVRDLLGDKREESDFEKGLLDHTDIEYNK